jgi:N-acetylmuramic acid 6-phosphate etherase
VKDRSQLLTEQRLPQSMNLDAMTIPQAIALMNEQDRIAVEAVEKEKTKIAAAIELVVAAFMQGGRLIYFGAGTSGRLGVLDAAECPPTFRSEPHMVQGVIAGGNDAMFRAQEGAEDSHERGAADVDAMRVDAKDVVMGIAAGGTTPYVHGALQRAAQLGAKTIFLTCVQAFDGEPAADVIIRPLSGPEVLTGSTRLKAGTATKLVLNQISTISMVRLGKCYENLMVDLRASNAKLQDRAGRIIGMVTGLDREAAAELLQRAQGQVKAAIVMHKRGVTLEEASRLLQQANGHLRQTLDGNS